MLGFDNESGFWLVHSTPKFPDYTNKTYSWPHNGIRNGQTFLCVTYAYQTLGLIGQYKFQICTSFKSYITYHMQKIKRNYKVCNCDTHILSRVGM